MLPLLSNRRLAVRVTPDAARQTRGGHPWIYANSITSVSDGGVAGDLAVLFDRHRRFLAIGLYDPDSPIRIRVLHHGSPITIDADFWNDRIAVAAAIREPLLHDDTDGYRTDGYRCINGENDGFPGLVLDRYASTMVMKIYSAAWLPHLATLLPLIQARWEPSAVVLRLSRTLHRHHGALEGVALLGELPLAPVR
ncbi:MAG: rRNA (guanine-N2)-methyltransferase, partial [Acidimicrobiia bacterium]|nr:rRNA (guanine-N2)-methyltransferase [Acidimicrobiia bacterium]